MENIDSIIASSIAHCKGNLQCENVALKAGMKEVILMSKEDVTSNVKKNKKEHIDNTMVFLLVVILVLNTALAVKGKGDIKLLSITAIILLLVSLSITLGNQIYLLSALGALIIGVLYALFKRD